ncbi:MAG: hypothetical protein E7001_00510 [Coriobacteriaceae bacterium]|nr:hypothetical protein [Coriobacteriaceae bacterium]
MTSKQKILGALAVIAVCAALQIVFRPLEGRGPAPQPPRPVVAVPKTEPEKREDSTPEAKVPPQATAPEDMQTPPAAPAPEQVPAEQVQKLGDDEEEADPESIPTPDDLPQEADEEEVSAAIAAWLTEQGLGSARNLEIVSKGEVSGVGVEAAPLRYWVYTGVRSDGQKVQLALTYDPSLGFDIGSY